MRKLTVSLTGVILILGINFKSYTQYPKVPEAIKDKTALEMEEAWRKSEKAWEKALPVIMDEARKGKPYVPWASRPTDLPLKQAASAVGQVKLMHSYSTAFKKSPLISYNLPIV